MDNFSSHSAKSLLEKLIIKPRGNSFCVYTASGDRNLGCGPGREWAVARIANIELARQQQSFVKSDIDSYLEAVRLVDDGAYNPIQNEDMLSAFVKSLPLSYNDGERQEIMEVMLKHLAGKHDQTDHGVKRASSEPTININLNSQELQELVDIRARKKAREYIIANGGVAVDEKELPATTREKIGKLKEAAFKIESDVSAIDTALDLPGNVIATAKKAKGKYDKAKEFLKTFFKVSVKTANVVERTLRAAESAVVVAPVVYGLYKYATNKRRGLPGGSSTGSVIRLGPAGSSNKFISSPDKTINKSEAAEDIVSCAESLSELGILVGDFAELVLTMYQESAVDANVLYRVNLLCDGLNDQMTNLTNSLPIKKHLPGIHDQRTHGHGAHASDDPLHTHSELDNEDLTEKPSTTEEALRDTLRQKERSGEDLSEEERQFQENPNMFQGTIPAVEVDRGRGRIIKIDPTDPNSPAIHVKKVGADHGVQYYVDEFGNKQYVGPANNLKELPLTRGEARARGRGVGTLGIRQRATEETVTYDKQGRKVVKPRPTVRALHDFTDRINDIKSIAGDIGEATSGMYNTVMRLVNSVNNLTTAKAYVERGALEASHKAKKLNRKLWEFEEEHLNGKKPEPPTTTKSDAEEDQDILPNKTLYAYIRLESPLRRALTGVRMLRQAVNKDILPHKDITPKDREDLLVTLRSLEDTEKEIKQMLSRLAVKVAADTEVEKHMPGVHDQEDHGGKRAGSFLDSVRNKVATTIATPGTVTPPQITTAMASDIKYPGQYTEQTPFSEPVQNKIKTVLEKVGKWATVIGGTTLAVGGAIGAGLVLMNNGSKVPGTIASSARTFEKGTDDLRSYIHEKTAKNPAKTNTPVSQPVSKVTQAAQEMDDALEQELRVLIGLKSAAVKSNNYDFVETASKLLKDIADTVNELRGLGRELSASGAMTPEDAEKQYGCSETDLLKLSDSLHAKYVALTHAEDEGVIKHLPGQHNQGSHAGFAKTSKNLKRSSMAKKLFGKVLGGKSIKNIYKSSDRDARLVEFKDGTRKMVRASILAKIAYGKGTGHPVGTMFSTTTKLHKAGFVSYAQAAYMFDHNREMFNRVMGLAKSGKRHWDSNKNRMITDKESA